MSTATLVPETWELHRRRCLADAAPHRAPATARATPSVRLRFADGFSHARSLAFLTSLVLVQAVIALVGLASVFDDTARRRRHRPRHPERRAGARREAPDLRRGAGPRRRRRASGCWRSRSGRSAPSSPGPPPMGQLERALQPDLRRRAGSADGRASMGSASCSPCQAGVLLDAARSSPSRSAARSGRPINNHAVDDVWGVARWPLGFLLLMTAHVACCSAGAPGGTSRPGRGWPSAPSCRCSCGSSVTVAARCLLPRQHLVRRHLRSAGRDGGPAAVVPAVRDRRAVRRQRRGPARSRPGRAGAAAGRREGRGVGARRRAGPRRSSDGGRRHRTIADASTGRGDRMRRTLEGVIGVPATEGNAVDVLRNGDEIFPAMLEAIERRRAHHRPPHVRLLGGRDRAGRSPTALSDRARAGSGSACCSTRGARTPWSKALIERMERRRRPGPVVPAAAAASGPARSTTGPTARC